MSIVFITHHNESIYESTKIETEEEKKPPVYRSKFSKYVRSDKCVDKSKRRKECGIMGKPKQPPPDPLEYLKKNSYKLPAVPCDPEELQEMKSLPKRELPPVPKRDEVIKEQNAKLKHEPKHFITVNIRNVLNMKPKEPEQNVVLDCYGTKRNLKDGLEPRFINTKVFGRMPIYMKHFIASREKLVQEERDKIGLMQPKCRYVTSDERAKLLAGLKSNWAELQKQYQGLPILTDTIPKKIYKTKLEADLKQLEKDIVLVERHPYIYVYQDDRL